MGYCLSRTAGLQAQADYPLSMHWISRFDRMWMGVKSYLKFRFMVIHTAHFLVSFCWNKTKNKFHFPNLEVTHSSHYLSEILLRNVFMVSAGSLICAAVPPWSLCGLGTQWVRQVTTRNRVPCFVHWLILRFLEWYQKTRSHSINKTDPFNITTNVYESFIQFFPVKRCLTIIRW